MYKNLLLSIIVFLGKVVIIPGVLVWLTKGTQFAAQLAAPHQIVFWAGLILIAAGAGLDLWTLQLFVAHGEGTPTPWKPPQKLVVLGPYRHVRNPMISGLLLILLGEALLLQSLPLLAWWGAFWLANIIFLQKFEERNLLAQHGEDYAQYMAHVPRWLPRLRPWTGTPEKND